MRPHRPGRPSELMNSFALCTLEPTRIDSISFWIVSSGAILGQPSELPSRDDSRSTIRPGYTRAGMCTGNTAGPCPFVTVSMHFGGRASLQLSHGLTSPHLHSRPRRIYIYISLARLFLAVYTPVVTFHPGSGRERPRVRRKDKGGGLVHARFIIPLWPGQKIHSPIPRAQRTGVCSRILTIRPKVDWGPRRCSRS